MSRRLAGSPATAATDLYGVCHVLFELITGRRRFDAATPEELLREVRTDSMPPPSKVTDDVPRHLEAVVAAALDRRPERRPASARTMAILSAGAHSRATAASSNRSSRRAISTSATSEGRVPRLRSRVTEPVRGLPDHLARTLAEEYVRLMKATVSVEPGYLEHEQEES